VRRQAWRGEVARVETDVLLLAPAHDNRGFDGGHHDVITTVYAGSHLPGSTVRPGRRGARSLRWQVLQRAATNSSCPRVMTGSALSRRAVVTPRERRERAEPRGEIGVEREWLAGRGVLRGRR
jgi:hypothetical protein